MVFYLFVIYLHFVFGMCDVFNVMTSVPMDFGNRYVFKLKFEKLRLTLKVHSKILGRLKLTVQQGRSLRLEHCLVFHYLKEVHS